MADTQSKPWLPYVLPMGVYMAFLVTQSNTNLVWLYPARTIAVATVLWWFRKEYVELQPAISWLGIGVGVAAIALWIGGDRFYPKMDGLLLAFEKFLSHLMNSPPPKGDLWPVFDPTTIHPTTLRYTFICFRIIGAVLVVPVMEELFWRAFLIRWIENPDFKSVPVGRFTWESFTITVVLFGLEHNQWLAGLICGALYNWLLYRTRSVWACVTAHAVSNAVLAAWVLARGDWKFW